MKQNLETIEKISGMIGSFFRGIVADTGGAVIATAFVLARQQKDPDVDMSSLETFLDTAKLDATIAEVLARNLNGLWDTVIRFVDKFNTDDLEAVVLYDNTFLEMSTPLSVIRLSSAILDIKSTDTILDACSGSATFPAYALYGSKISSYTGIEINYNRNDIAILRSYLLGEKYTFIINNALSYKYPCAYDKIFSNYPFAIKGSDMDDCRKELAEYFELDPVSIARCSSDWLFNSTVIRNLKETGKAVVIMTNGAAFNKPDSILRKIFVERGYIEAVINLPPRLFTEFSIPVTMLVLSHNNNSIKMINAENIYSRGERKNLTLSDDDLNMILNCLNNGGDNTIVVNSADMAEHDYSLMASHYLEKPVINNGVEFRNIIKSITRGAQIKPETLETYKSDTPTDFRYISLSNVNYGTINIEEDQQYLTELPKQLEKFVVPKNALVLSKMASPTFRSAVVSSDNDQTIVATGNLYIIEIDESKANPYFIQAFFDSRIGETALNYVSGGTVVKNISTEGVKSVVIPLPPIEEQNAIAQKYQAALDEYDILKKKLQRVLERKRTLINGEG